MQPEIVAGLRQAANPLGEGCHSVLVDDVSRQRRHFGGIHAADAAVQDRPGQIAGRNDVCSNDTERLIDRAVDDILQKQWRLISRVKIRPRDAARAMALGAIGGEVRTNALFEAGSGVGDRDEFGQRRNVSFIQGRI